jgi:pilus assembly protein CpaE
LALRAEAAEPVLLADLNPQPGDAAVLLGLTPRFTVAEVLTNARRLDSVLVSTLVAEHASGVSFIAAPDQFDPSLPVEEAAVAKFVELARNQYPWVVIDAGRGLGAGVEPMLELATVVYLVVQLDIPSLHHAQRFISYMQRAGRQTVEVVVNRYDSRRAEFDDSRIASALGLAPKWKVPNDFTAVHRAANTGQVLIRQKSPVAEVLRAMVRSASGKAADPLRRKGNWKLFG